MIFSTFDSNEALNQALAERIANDLKNLLEIKEHVYLLVSGGSTPKTLFPVLSKLDLDWKKITIGLVDERFVDNTSEFSNEKLVHEALLQNQAKEAEFLPMVLFPNDESINLEAVNKTYTVFAEPDLVLLGMGEDGHTASIFPNDEQSSEALVSNENCLSTKAPVNPQHRITCTAKILKKAVRTYLTITGEKKKSVFENAASNGLPIAFFTETITEVFYTK